VIGSRLPEQYAADAALLSAVADPVRLQLMAQLASGERCVCDLVTEPAIPANLLSYHLKVLRDADLIEGTRRGRRIEYALRPDALARLDGALPRPVAALALAGR